MIQRGESIAQSCPALCDPMECSSPGSVYGILQVRIVEWVVISSSRDLPSPGNESRSPALQADSLLSEVNSHCKLFFLDQSHGNDEYAIKARSQSYISGVKSQDCYFQEPEIE